jgi:phosphoglycolate phosphatase-like HAD superfamily hydrolase
MTYHPNYQAVLFDLDGTLCDTALDFTLALNRLLAEEQRKSLSLSQVRSQV